MEENWYKEYFMKKFRTLFVATVMALGMTCAAYADDGVTDNVSCISVLSDEISTGCIEGTALLEESTETVAEVASETVASIGTDTSAEFGASLGEFKLTAYCGCRKCNGKWTGQPTALGTGYEHGRTIAVDRRVIPIGTWVYINIPGEGWQKFRAEDTGSAIKGNRIDIYVDSHSACNQAKYNTVCEVRLAK